MMGQIVGAAAGPLALNIMTTVNYLYAKSMNDHLMITFFIFGASLPQLGLPIIREQQLACSSVRTCRKIVKTTAISSY